MIARAGALALPLPEAVMAAITISRQMNSQGDELALRVAEQLGWRRVCRDLINEAARAAGAPQVALAEIDELGLLGIHPPAKEWRAYQRQIERIILELANQGNVVIVGRGGQVVLRGRPDVLHVRVVAPLEVRVAWLQQEKGLSLEAAQTGLAQSDKSRAGFLRRSFKVQVNDPTLYHLTVNTGFLDLPQAATVIIQAWRQLIESQLCQTTVNLDQK
jgi:cytidylate kinase